jgi:hypothetical protein
VNQEAEGAGQRGHQLQRSRADRLLAAPATDGAWVRDYVVCPTRLDKRYRDVANDGPDATELATRLDLPMPKD